MFSFAIFKKTLRDSAVLLAACSLGVIAFVVLFVWAMLNMGPDLLQFAAKFGFIRKILEMTFGLKVEGELSESILFAVCFTHLMVMMLTWSVIIATNTRTVVGEIEKGTADLLLSLPVNRYEVYLSTSLAWILFTVVLAACPAIGLGLGAMIFETKEAIDLTRYLAPAVNLVALLLAVGGVSSLVSSLFNRRGPAIATIIGIGLASMVLNLLEPFIPLFKHIRFLGLLNYFRPVDIVRTGQWPLISIAILVSLGLFCWLVGLFVFCRKDIQTA